MSDSKFHARRESLLGTWLGRTYLAIYGGDKERQEECRRHCQGKWRRAPAGAPSSGHCAWADCSSSKAYRSAAAGCIGGSESALRCAERGTASDELGSNN